MAELMFRFKPNPPPRLKEPYWMRSYYRYTMEQAEKRLGISFMDLALGAKSAERMVLFSSVDLKLTKEVIHKRMCRVMTCCGMPDSNVALGTDECVRTYVDIVLTCVIGHHVWIECDRFIKCRRERTIVAPDRLSGGRGDIVVLNPVKHKVANVVFTVEIRSDSVSNKLVKTALMIKDAFDSNTNSQKVHGFIVTGHEWVMLAYDGESFKISRPMPTMLTNMASNRSEWVDRCSPLMEVMYAILEDVPHLEDDNPFR